MKTKRILALVVILAAARAAFAQPPLFTDAFPKDEFAARRARVMQAIGDAVVVVQGATETSSYEKFRQSNQFFYLTGVEVPRAILVIDGRSKSSTLYIAPRNPNAERSEGPVLTPGDEAVKLTGIERVVPREEFGAAAKALTGRIVYTTFRGETRGAGTPDREAAHAAARAADPWDGQKSREDWFMGKLREQAAGHRAREPRSHPRRDAHDQEPARDRGHPGVHPHRRAGHHGSDAVGGAGNVRVRARGHRRLRVQEEQRAGHRATSRWSRPGRTRRGRITTRRRRGRRTATSSFSTTRRTTSTTPPT